MARILPGVATKARHLKTPVQLWIIDNRKRLGLEPADLAALTGVSEATARGWESRGRPSEDALLLLERRFGSPIPRGDQAAGTADLATALNALAGELRAAREERELVEVRLRTLEAQVALLARSEGAASPERFVLREIAE